MLTFLCRPGTPGVDENTQNAEHAANRKGLIEDMRSQGISSVREIAAELNQRGIPTVRGGEWHPTTAARLLDRLAV